MNGLGGKRFNFGHLDPRRAYHDPMHELTPSNTLAFLRRFRLKGSVIRRFTLRNTAADRVAVKLILTVNDASADDKVKLAVVITDVEEYRFQKRPAMNKWEISCREVIMVQQQFIRVSSIVRSAY